MLYALVLFLFFPSVQSVTWRIAMRVQGTGHVTLARKDSSHKIIKIINKSVRVSVCVLVVLACCLTLLDTVVCAV